MNAFATRPLVIAAIFFVGITHARAEELVLVAGGGKGTDGAPAAEAALGQPFGCAIDQEGNLYIADYTDHRVRKVDARGVISTLGGTGEKGFGGDGGPATAGRFAAMHDLVVAENGDVYIADSDNRRVRKIDAKTGILSTVAGTGEKKSTGDGGPGDQAGLDGVASLFFDPTGEKLYITGFSSVVRVLDVETGIIDTVKGLPGGRSVAVDSKGNIYVGGGVTLRVMRPDGTVELLHDAKTAEADAVKLGFNPKHLGFDAEENVLICDDFAHQVKKWNVAEKKLVVFAGSGEKGTAGLGGPALAAQLNAPHGVYFHRPTETVYICDSRNGRVLKIVK